MSRTLIWASIVACIAGCEAGALNEREQLARHKPLKIAEIDGHTLWKVEDGTAGGQKYVYFTTQSERSSDE